MKTSENHPKKCSGIRISGLYKSFPVDGVKLEVLRGIDLELQQGEITVLLGRSGCGKTTLLRVVSGLETADSGTVTYEAGTKLGMVFQEPRLMPWLSVRKNIAFGLSKEETDWKKIDGLIAMTGLSGFEKAYPAQLSGGMQQRVALARALAMGTSFILMDEPFAALDYFTRQTMQQELLRIQQEEKKGILFVTHSIDEALTLGHRIAVIDEGRCKTIYDLQSQSRPRDLMSDALIDLKRRILMDIGGEHLQKDTSMR